MAGRPKQPKCKHCGKALYKRMDEGKVKPSDPYAWCRNKVCKKYNKPQKKSRFTALGAPVEKNPPAPVEKNPPSRSKRRKARPTPKDTKPDSGEVESVPRAKEPEALTKARARIKAVIDAVDDQLGSSAVGLALALVSQETGNDVAANRLIQDYNLTELYGILPK